MRTPTRDARTLEALAAVLIAVGLGVLIGYGLLPVWSAAGCKDELGLSVPVLQILSLGILGALGPACYALLAPGARQLPSDLMKIRSRADLSHGKRLILFID